MSDLLRCDNCGKVCTADYAFKWWNVERSQENGHDRYIRPRGDLCSDACLVEFVGTRRYMARVVGDE